MDISIEQWLLLILIVSMPVLYAGYRITRYVTQDWEF